MNAVEKAAVRNLVNQVSRNLWQLGKFGHREVADALAPVRRLLGDSPPTISEKPRVVVGGIEVPNDE